MKTGELDFRSARWGAVNDLPPLDAVMAAALAEHERASTEYGINAGPYEYIASARTALESAIRDYAAQAVAAERAKYAIEDLAVKLLGQNVCLSPEQAADQARRLRFAAQNPPQMSDNGNRGS